MWLTLVSLTRMFFYDINIVTRDLQIEVMFDWEPPNDKDYINDWDKRLISLLNRMAKLGHFERLTITCCRSCDRRLTFVREKAEAIAEAFVAVIEGNKKLAYLDLSGFTYKRVPSRRCDLRTFSWSSQLEKLFKAMEEHEQLETFVLKDYPVTADPDYSWLKRLLWRNRNITVLDSLGKRCTDGNIIDKLYSCNQIRNDLAPEIPGTGLVIPSSPGP